MNRNNPEFAKRKLGQKELKKYIPPIDVSLKIYSIFNVNVMVTIIKPVPPSLLLLLIHGTNIRIIRFQVISPPCWIGKILHLHYLILQ